MQNVSKEKRPTTECGLMQIVSREKGPMTECSLKQNVSSERGPNIECSLRQNLSEEKGSGTDSLLVPNVSGEKGPEKNTVADDYCSVSSVGDKNFIVVNQIRAVSMRAPVQIHGQHLQAVIDTGAEVTVINKKIFDELPEKDRPVIKRADRGLVVAEKDKKMGSHGMATVTFTIGDIQHQKA